MASSQQLALRETAVPVPVNPRKLGFFKPFSSSASPPAPETPAQKPRKRGLLLILSQEVFFVDSCSSLVYA